MTPKGDYHQLDPGIQPAGNLMHILVVASESSPATRMIYELPFRVISESGFSWRIVSEYYLKPERLVGIHTLILYRCFQGSTLSIVRLANLMKIKVIYELDDDLLDPPEDAVWGKGYRNRHLPQIIEMFLKRAHLVKAGSPELARRLRERGYPAVYQPYAAKNCDISVRKNELPYRVGYFGSPHHQDDIEMVFPSLLAMKELFQEQIEFEFIGCYPRNWQQLKAKIFPYEFDYELFLEALAKRCWSLGLAPLRETSFNQAKSNSKFRDLTSAGILGLYTDSEPYRSTVIHGENGWLVRASSEDWSDVMTKALLSPSRPAMLSHAKQLIDDVYNPKVVAQNWITLIKTCLC